MRIGTSIVLAVAVVLQAAPLIAQGRAGRDFDAEIEGAIRSAKDAAGFEHLGTLNRIYLLPASGGENTSDNVPRYVTDPSAAPPREEWYADPARVFDNLYFVGGSEHSSWALVTSEGIIIIDTIYPYNSEELIVGGLRRLGLDPEDIRYVIISHAHGDHIGGAQMLQERYGARVVMGEPDWDSVERYPNRFRSMAPRRDIVATDGMQITLGDQTVTVWETPGHTPGRRFSSRTTRSSTAPPRRTGYSPAGGRCSSWDSRRGATRTSSERTPCSGTSR
jgi:metallo-beta-lactamase class B